MVDRRGQIYTYKETRQLDVYMYICVHVHVHVCVLLCIELTNSDCYMMVY